MKESKVTPAFLNILGQAVLDFGFMESCVRHTIITLSRDSQLARALVTAGNAVSENLDLLRRLCHLRVQPSSLPPWLDAITHIQELFSKRNRIFHGMFFEHQDRLLLAKVRKGKRGSSDDWTEAKFDPQLVHDVLKHLSDRRRQLMDFSDDYATSDDGPPHTQSQDAYPSLSIKSGCA